MKHASRVPYVPMRPTPDVHELTAWAATYRLLGRLWRREVDGPLLRELRSEPLADAWQAAGGRVPGGEEDAVLDQLALDYCQLFLGPKDHLPPYQSVWTSGQFQDKTSASMRRYLGLIADGQAWTGETMLDHLGIQLEAMAVIMAELASPPGASAERSGSLAELAGRFFQDHLTWPSRLFTAASARATTLFYQRMIEVTREFLHSGPHAPREVAASHGA